MNTMRSWAEIDLAALERNLNLIRSALPQPMKYVSVVKADAYGHGILPTAARLMQSGVDLFAVANIKEAAEIREMASGWPILVLGPLLEDEDSALLEYDLIATLSSASELPRFAALARKRKQKIKIHLKIDSGMGRLGAWWEEAGELIAETLATQEIELCGLLTHFADPRDLAFTDLQRSRFQKIHDALPAAK
ncbi:MAG TPA: alanine racemase, partial [Opitutae bacterium]|nr:alanine racemase [Opitutae bacterium]